VRISLQILLFWLSLGLQAQEFYNGVSFVASRAQLQKEQLTHLNVISADAAALMPFAFMPDAQGSVLRFNRDNQWFGETKAGIKQYGDLLKAEGYKLMIKPQIWIRGGVFTGTIEMKTEADWLKFEDTYRSYILTFAEVAEELNASVYCIGTELKRFASNRPDFFCTLIEEVRQLYSGQLTYAANWDEFEDVSFWSELDHIGIDAYFPLLEKEEVTSAELISAWTPWLDRIQSVYKVYSKPILFTEYGYRSMKYATAKPWLVDRTLMDVDLKNQIEAYRALYEVFWNKSWFSGGFLWKWFIDYPRSGGASDNRFTPQNKPVEELISSYYN
jgi:hypothetical protein